MFYVFYIIQLNKLPTHADKLKRLFDRIDGIIKEYKPDELALEAPFFGKNVQSNMSPFFFTADGM